MSHAQNNWQPSANLNSLKQRAELLAAVRLFFSQRNVMEVETPLLCPHTVTDRYIDSFAVDTNNGERYLQSSPEYAMKRLLAAGSGPIYQLSKAFRHEEASVHHNPEFTLLEWYRPGWNDRQLMQEINKLMQAVAQAKPAIFITYQDCFINTLGIDPLSCDKTNLQKLIQQKSNGEISATMLDSDKNGLLDLCFNRWIESSFNKSRPTFVTDFPASQAALAMINPEDPRKAKRFELYYQGLELANGFQELTDAQEQKQRFEADQDYRQKQNACVPAIDEKFIAALEAGLPDCSGVALGIDRLLMCLTRTSIDQVLSFSWNRV